VRGACVVAVLGLNPNGVHTSLPRIVDRSAMYFEMLESSGVEAEAGLAAAQQRESTVQYDGMEVSGRT